MVINRHGDFNVGEIYRVLKPGGLFITQQVGAENDRELVELLCGERSLPFLEQYLDYTVRKFRDTGFEILEAQECFRPIKFFDVGALVWFARIIQWEFPGFSVDACLDRLLNAQRILEQDGCIEGRIHRFFLVARKEEAKRIMDSAEGYIILDVRTQEEYDQGHIPGEVVISHEEIAEKAEKVMTDKGQLILVYCRSGRRKL